MPSCSGLNSFQQSKNDKATPTRHFVGVRRKLLSDAAANTEVEANVLINSIPLERFQEQNLAGILKCSICLGLPKNSVYTVCSHIFCKECIDSWLEIRNSCLMCRSFLDETDLLALPPQLRSLFDILQVQCMYTANGCNELCTISKLDEQENIESMSQRSFLQ